MTKAATPDSAQHPFRGTSLSHRLSVCAALLALSLVFAIAALVIYWIFVQTRPGQALDEAALKGAEIGRDILIGAAETVLNIVSVVFLIIAIIVVGVFAVGRKRYGLAIAAMALVVGANVSTQVMKHALERPEYGVSTINFNSLPSGHTTVAASVAAALILVVPRQFRILTVLLAGGYATATGIATLSAGWHRPADVITALLVVAAWTALVSALVQLRHPVVDDPSQATAQALSPPAKAVVWVLVVAGLLTLCVAFVLMYQTQAGAAPLNTTDQLLVAYGGGTAGIAGVAALVFALALALAPIAARTPWVQASK
ncbi:phosphatase PAP2 family protein [Saxibacter everestensis]|uniref:Phosphatase PAP2 family protein n=1 Tax=Saxibacter everestensis TaxID=2909229 RepID=A0ABY8QS31_9MICO|nr:phosphatase PAP2 family protein [Brevibacteriaceae bacterium ZFBP1038]